MKPIRKKPPLDRPLRNWQARLAKLHGTQWKAIIQSPPMGFHSSCKDLAASLPAGNVDRLILEFLPANGVGGKSPQSWTKIKAHLRPHVV